MTTIESPRAAYPRRSRRFNIEKWAWIYMRASGVLLIVLIFGHLFVNLYAGQGVLAIDFAFVAGKYATPFWQVWDFLMLWLALVHGSNGMRTIVNDYVHSPRVGMLLKAVLAAAAVVLLILGSLVIWTFDPCPTTGLAADLPAFCATR